MKGVYVSFKMNNSGHSTVWRGFFGLALSCLRSPFIRSEVLALPVRAAALKKNRLLLTIEQKYYSQL